MCVCVCVCVCACGDAPWAEGYKVKPSFGSRKKRKPRGCYTETVGHNVTHSRWRVNRRLEGERWQLEGNRQQLEENRAVFVGLLLRKTIQTTDNNHVLRDRPVHKARPTQA